MRRSRSRHSIRAHLNTAGPYGSERRRLTLGPNRYGIARFSSSPDGSRIAFVSNKDLAVVNADGSGLATIATGNFMQYTPAWSRNGTGVHISRSNGSESEILLVAADGTGEVVLPSINGGDVDVRR